MLHQLRFQMAATAFKVFHCCVATDIEGTPLPLRTRARLMFDVPRARVAGMFVLFGKAVPANKYKQVLHAGQSCRRAACVTIYAIMPFCLPPGKIYIRLHALLRAPGKA